MREPDESGKRGERQRVARASQIVKEHTLKLRANLGCF